MPKVYDCFTFFNELDLLEVRLNELDGIVDRFVLCESPYTFRGQPKPLVFQENRERFARFLPKIEHIVVDDLPLGGGNKERHYFVKERFQRDALARGLRGAAPDDYVILCDIDEIPRASAIEAIVRANGPKSVHLLEMDYYIYFLNLLVSTGWDKPRMARYGDIRRLQSLRSGGPSWAPKERRVLSVLRQWKRMVFGVRPRPWVRVPDAGWHFTSMNGPAAVREKMMAYSHVRPEMENETAIIGQITAVLKRAAANSGDATPRIEPLERLPAFIRDNADRFGGLIASAETLAAYEALSRR
jgi:beta-1,4-mannosyl-glycoprotein beta-1,4-N-acetylglucosaminyltransferase